ncbi:hypothetical protein A2U01_0082197, partial [Trifolium medium]|nr:hypothetical protein [Trifolium medium]
MRAEGILRDEGRVEQHGSWWKVGTIINLKTRWRLLRFAFKLDEAKKIGGVDVTGATCRKAWCKAPSRDVLLLLVLVVAQGAG